MFAERPICSWVGALGLAAGAFCQTYVTFSVDGGTVPNSLNERGAVTGFYFDRILLNPHGFVRDPGGTITTFDVPGSPETRPFSINDEGAITGSYALVIGGEGNFMPAVLQVVNHGFITGNTTITMGLQYFKKGEVHAITAYPTDGVPGIELQVSNLRYEKFVLPNFQWVWIMWFELANLGGNGVVYDMYISILPWPKCL